MAEQTIDVNGTQTVQKSAPEVQCKIYTIATGGSEVLTLSNTAGKDITVRVTIESQDEVVAE